MANPSQTIIGPIFLGYTIALLVSGASYGQMWFYFQTYKCDPLRMKLFILLLFLLTTTESILILLYLYKVLVDHYGEVEFLENRDKVFISVPSIAGFLSSSVQLYLARRLYLLTKRRILPAFIVLFTLGNLACSVIFTVEAKFNPSFFALHSRVFETNAIVWNATACIADALITIGLVWHLKQFDCASPSTKRVSHRIIRVTVQSGLLTTIWAVTHLILYLTNTPMHMAIGISLSKIYVLTMMTSLNDRAALATSLQDTDHHETKLDFKAPSLVACSTCSSVRSEDFIE